MSVLADYNLPFAIALGIMLLLAALQVTGIGELDMGADLDVDAGVGNVGMMGALTTLLGVGRVPFFVWLMVFLFLFAGLGVSIQGLAQNLTGGPLNTWLGAAFALIAAVPLTSVLVRPLARVMPRDETSAVGLDSLVGRRAVITTGRAAKGYLPLAASSLVVNVWPVLTAQSEPAKGRFVGVNAGLLNPSRYSEAIHSHWCIAGWQGAACPAPVGKQRN